MDTRVVAGIFSQISRMYDRFLGAVTVGRIHSWQRELVSGMNKDGNWLDIGTGTGEVLRKLGKEYAGVKVGVDPAFGMLEVAKKKCPDCYFVQAVGESLPFRDGSFGNISLSLVFRHLQDKDRFLDEARRLLADGGKIGIIDIGKFKGTGFVLFLMRTVLKPVGLLIFGKDKWDFFVHSVEESYTAEEVRSMLESKGFKVESVNRKFLGAVHILTAVKTVSKT